MPNTPQESMEDVSIAYMQGLCAYNGYTLSIERRDNDGVDITIKCKGYPSTTSGCLKYSPTLDIQLKSSFARFKQKRNGDITFILESKNYNPLAELNKRIFKSANRFVVNVVYILKDCKCTYFP